MAVMEIAPVAPRAHPHHGTLVTARWIPCFNSWPTGGADVVGAVVAAVLVANVVGVNGVGRLVATQVEGLTAQSDVAQVVCRATKVSTEVWAVISRDTVVGWISWGAAIASTKEMAIMAKID